MECPERTDIDRLITKDLEKLCFRQFPVWAWTDDQEKYRPIPNPGRLLPDDEGTFVRQRSQPQQVLPSTVMSWNPVSYIAWDCSLARVRSFLTRT